jgi:uncharacterized protein
VGSTWSRGGLKFPAETSLYCIDFHLGQLISHAIVGFHNRERTVGFAESAKRTCIDRSIQWFASKHGKPYGDSDHWDGDDTLTTPSFLTAEWRSLVMWNVTVDPALLRPMVPAKTELDLWNGEALISLVGFRFLNTRLRGWPIPFHQNFNEVNLRFYVRRKEAGEWRRGVVFIKEIVHLPAVTFVARWVYGENYVTRRMRHSIIAPTETAAGRFVYEWHDRGTWMQLAAEVSGPLTELSPGSDADFILEHYWGYARQSDGSTCEYAVEHPRWHVWPTVSGSLHGDTESLYGAEFAAALKQPPHSVVAADGSPIVVRRGTRLPRD